MIISGPAEASTELYAQVNKLIPKLTAQQETEEPTNYDVPANRVLLQDRGDAEMTLDEAVTLADQNEADIPRRR